MPFQPLIVVILLIFLAILSFALFIWFLLAMGRDRKLVKEQKTKRKEQSQKQVANKLVTTGLPPVRPKIGYLSKKELAGSEKTKSPERKAKPSIPPYQELRPRTKNKLSSAKSAKQRIDDIKSSEDLDTKTASPKAVISARPSIKDIKLSDLKAKKDKPKLKTIEPKEESAKTEPKVKTKDDYRGLNATKDKQKKEKLDPFDSFVEANKKLG